MSSDRVLMVSGNGPDHACGVAHFTERLLRQLVADRPDTSFIWLSRRARLKQLPIDFQAKRLVHVRPWHTWRPPSWRLAGALMRAWRPRIVHIQDEIYSFHETRAAVELARHAKNVGARVVLTLHEYHVELPSVRFTDELVSLADEIFVQDARNGIRCSERTGREPAAIGWSPANIDPLPHAIEPITNRLVTFGLLSPGKGLELVYEALKRVKAYHPDLTWVIMGPLDPEGNAYHRQLKQRLSESWIVFTGGGTKQLSEVGFRTALASASLMLLPFADGCSPRRTTLQAAWAFGLATITTAPEVPEVAIRDGENCSLVPGGDTSLPEQVDAWFGAVMRLLADEDQREHLRQGSLEAARAHSWRKLGAQHDAVYSKSFSLTSP